MLTDNWAQLKFKGSRQLPKPKQVVIFAANDGNIAYF